MRALGLVVCALLFGCSNGSTGGNDASVDAPTSDGTVKDAPSDAGSSVDAGSDATGCGAMCRLYSQYCNTAPCTCLALASTQTNPTCDAGTVNCTIDPCAGKTAVCTSNGCEVQ